MIPRYSGGLKAKQNRRQPTQSTTKVCDMATMEEPRRTGSRARVQLKPLPKNKIGGKSRKTRFQTVQGFDRTRSKFRSERSLPPYMYELVPWGVPRRTVPWSPESPKSQTLTYRRKPKGNAPVGDFGRSARSCRMSSAVQWVDIYNVRGEPAQKKRPKTPQRAPCDTPTSLRARSPTKPLWSSMFSSLMSKCTTPRP